MFASSARSAFAAAIRDRTSEIDGPYFRLIRAIFSRRVSSVRQSFGIGLDRFGRVARGGGQIRDAALELFRFLGVRELAGIDRRELGKRPRRLPEPVGRRILRLRERGKRGFARAPDPICMRQAAAIGKQRLFLPFSGLRRFDLADLEV